MAIDKVLYRTQKEKMLLDFDAGAMTKSVGEYLEQAGIKDHTRFTFGGSKALELVKKTKELRDKDFKAKKPAKIAEPYIQLGLSGKDLVCQIKDNKNAKFEDNATMLKNFAGEIDKLKNATGTVVNIDEDNDSIINDAVDAHGKRLNVPVKTPDTVEFKGLTGNIVICAHGTPKVLPGKVIGVELGGKTADQIADLLTANPDKAKRIDKTYAGIISLAGCFTASGGPEGEKEDPVFAKKVRDVLGSRGYKNARVVGMPGATITTEKGDKDDYGTKAKVGEEMSYHAMEDDEESLKAYQLKIDANVEKLNQASDNWKGSPDEFDNHPKVKELVAQMKKDSAEIDRLVENQKNAPKKSQVGKVNPSKAIIGLHGYFGPDKYKTKPWYKKLFK